MKQISIKFIPLLLLVSGLSSCLKEAPQNIDPSKGTSNVIEFANTGDNVGKTTSAPRFTTDLGSLKAGETAEINVNVSYSGAENAPEDISVSLVVDQASLDAFNTINGTDYETPAESVFAVPTTAVIKKGERLSQIKLKVTNTEDFDFNVNYAVALKITSTTKGVISSNYGTAVYSFSARNIYDGIYDVTATAPMVDAVNSALTGYYPITMKLITFTGNSIAMYDGEYFSTGYYHPIKSGTSTSAYGAFSPVFYFDASGNITSVGNYYGENAGGNLRSGLIDPTGVNKITFKSDGSVDNFEVSYFMIQNAISTGYKRTSFHEKFTYVSGR